MSALLSFKGKSIHAINDSGRLSIPSRFRDVLKSKYGNDVLVLITMGTHIAGYPVFEWTRLEKMWDENPPKNNKLKKFLRYLYSTAEEVVVDRQGRILIPQILRESIKLSSECVVTGQRTKIEIWPKEIWDKEYEYVDKNQFFGLIQEEFPDLNI